MRRRTYEFEVIQIILSVIVLIATIFLFFKFNTHSILFPIVFGAASLLSFIHAFEGVLYNKNRVIKKTRIAGFIILALILAGITYLSARVVL